MAVSQSLAPNSDPPSQADTPMTDANEEQVTSVPVDSADAQMTVGYMPFSHTPTAKLRTLHSLNATLNRSGLKSFAESSWYRVIRTLQTIR